MESNLNETLNSLDIDIEIKNLLLKNKLCDLKRFLQMRESLNNYNMSLIYFFHVIQSAGIMTTTIAAGFNIKELIWVGIGLNLLASLINIFEQTNNNISQKLLKNIVDIRNNNYIDEGLVIDLEKKSEKKN